MKNDNFKKKLFCSLLSALLCTSVLAGCTNEKSPAGTDTDAGTVTDTQTGQTTSSVQTEDISPVIETPAYVETEVGTENTLTSAGETVTLRVDDNKIYVINLATTASGVNMIAPDTEFPLPTYGIVNDEEIELQWSYVSTISYENKEVNGVLTNGLLYRFEEPTQHLQLNVYCVVRPDISGPIEFYSEVINNNASDYRIKPMEIAAFRISVPSPESTQILTLKKQNLDAESDYLKQLGSNDYKGTGSYIYNFDETDSVVIYESTITGSNKGYLLAYYLDRGSEDGVFMALEWSNGAMKLQNNGDQTATLSVPTIEYPSDFNTEIPAGETLEIPSVYLMPYDGSIDNGSNVFKSWFFDCKVQPTLRDNPDEPLTQMNIGNLSHADAAAVGIEAIKSDYGWWSGVSFFGSDIRAYESTWTLLADGLDSPGTNLQNQQTLQTQLEELGLDWTIYVLLHDNLDENNIPTDQFGEFNSVTHPEWFSNENTWSTACFADLGNVDCVSYLKDKMTKLFQLTGASTWRTDFEPIAHGSDKENRHDANGRDVMYWCTVGFEELVDHLYQEVDGFRYESCSCGGGMKDLFTATKAVVINLDDKENYLGMRMNFYDSSYVFHPTQLQIITRVEKFDPLQEELYLPALTVSDADESYDFRDAMLDMGFRSSILSVPHYVAANAYDYYDYFVEYLAIYKEKVRPLSRDGELYHILPRPAGINWDGMMYADPDSENEIKGVVFLFKPSQETSDTYHVVLDGLYEDTVYQLTFEDRPEQNCTATGKELMENGIDVEIKYIGSEMIWITESK